MYIYTQLLRLSSRTNRGMLQLWNEKLHIFLANTEGLETCRRGGSMGRDTPILLSHMVTGPTRVAWLYRKLPDK